MQTNTKFKNFVKVKSAVLPRLEVKNLSYIYIYIYNEQAAHLLMSDDGKTVIMRFYLIRLPKYIKQKIKSKFKRLCKITQKCCNNLKKIKERGLFFIFGIK